MKQQLPCDDKALLMAYLYDECDAAERRLVEEHLASCSACVVELEQLRGVRGALRAWVPPDQALGFRIVREEASVLRPSRWWSRPGVRIPAWAQAAAAVLLVAAGAAVADVGVFHRPPSTADLARLERQLEQQQQQISTLRALTTARPAVEAAPGTTPVPSPVVVPSPIPREEQARLLRQVQSIVDDMGRRQQQAVDQQIAQRFLRLAHDVDTQRIADQRQFLQGLNQIDQRTTQITRVQNYLLRNVANVQEIK